jgi:hypothetical protein
MFHEQQQMISMWNSFSPGYTMSARACFWTKQRSSNKTDLNLSVTGDFVRVYWMLDLLLTSFLYSSCLGDCFLFAFRMVRSVAMWQMLQYGSIKIITGHFPTPAQCGTLYEKTSRIFRKSHHGAWIYNIIMSLMSVMKPDEIYDVFTQRRPKTLRFKIMNGHHQWPHLPSECILRGRKILSETLYQGFNQ